MTRPQTSIERLGIDQPENILKSAEKVFGRKGSSATMADIALEAGISQGLAYRYFESKDEIFKTLLKHSLQSAEEYDKMMKKLPGTPAEKLHTIVTRLIERRREQSGYYQFLYQILADDSLPAELKERMTRHGKIFLNEMRRLIVEGQKTGEIAKDNPDQLLEAVMACIEGLWKRMAYSDPGKVSESYPDSEIIFRMLKPDRR